MQWTIFSPLRKNFRNFAIFRAIYKIIASLRRNFFLAWQFFPKKFWLSLRFPIFFERYLEPLLKNLNRRARRKPCLSSRGRGIKVTYQCGEILKVSLPWFQPKYRISAHWKHHGRQCRQRLLSRDGAEIYWKAAAHSQSQDYKLVLKLTLSPDDKLVWNNRRCESVFGIVKNFGSFY